VDAEKPKSKRYFKFYTMNKLVKKSMLVVAVAASLASCSTYEHSFRSIDVDQKNSVQAKIQVDVAVTPDFSKRMKAQSTKNHKTPQAAKDEAYYNAIIENQIDVLISPIYSVTVRGGVCEATVHGYAGFYKVIPKDDDASAAAGDAKKAGAAEAKKADGDFDKKVEDLKKLAKIDGVLASEEQKVYKINQTCGDCKSNEPLSLLTVTTNKSSLVDVYEKVLNIGTGNKSVISTNGVSVKGFLGKFSKK
jgi:hypothetical protein